jgi:hypothetical protein
LALKSTKMPVGEVVQRLNRFAAMSRRRAPVVGREENEMTYKVISATKRYLLRCALGAFALGLAGQSLTGLAAPAISRADEPCAPGLGVEPRLEVSAAATGRPRLAK